MKFNTVLFWPNINAGSFKSDLKKKISERILVGEISLPSSPHLRHNPKQLLSLLKPFLRRGRRKAVSQHFSNVGTPGNQRQAY